MTLNENGDWIPTKSLNPTSYFRKIIVENKPNGELKVEYKIELTKYDTSTMPNHKTGTKGYTGYTCQIYTLKPNKSYPKNRVDIDVSNKLVRKAISDMYEAYDLLILNETLK